MATAAGKHTFIVVYYDRYYRMNIATFVPYDTTLVNEYMDALDELEKEGGEEPPSGAW